MANIYPTTQSLFVNKQLESPTQQVPIREPKNNLQKGAALAPIEGEFVKIGDSVSFSEAENLFERANQYAQMNADISKSAHNGLQAYTAIDTETKREALRSLMGVDLYA
jgi:hypothetical protein